MPETGEGDILDDLIRALGERPMTRNELVRALSAKHRLKGSDVNSWLYTYADRYFTADRDPTEGLPTWSLSVSGQQRLKGLR